MDQVHGQRTPLSPTATIADFQTALTQVRYENTNVTNPSEATRTATFRVTDETTAGSNATTIDIQVTDEVQTRQRLILVSVGRLVGFLIHVRISHQFFRSCMGSHK